METERAAPTKKPDDSVGFSRSLFLLVATIDGLALTDGVISFFGELGWLAWPVWFFLAPLVFFFSGLMPRPAAVLAMLSMAIISEWPWWAMIIIIVLHLEAWDRNYKERQRREGETKAGDGGNTAS